MEDVVRDYNSIALVITQANAIERTIDSIIANYYTRREGDYQGVYLAFIYDVLYDKGVTLNTKIEILFKTLKKHDSSRIIKGSKKNFQDWLKIRNILAHGQYIHNPGNGKILFAGKSYSPKNEKDRFMEYQRKILHQLDLFSELYGPYFYDIPISGKQDVNNIQESEAGVSTLVGDSDKKVDV